MNNYEYKLYEFMQNKYNQDLHCNSFLASLQRILKEKPLNTNSFKDFVSSMIENIKSSRESTCLVCKYHIRNRCRNDFEICRFSKLYFTYEFDSFITNLYDEYIFSKAEEL